MHEGPPLHVLIAGAGRAGLEAMLRLHRLAGPRVRITLLAPNDEFRNHALDVLLPFATTHARRQVVALAPAPSSPVLEGVLLTERDALLMRCEAPAGGAPPEVLRRGAPGWPPTKVTGRELALHLDAPASGRGG